MKKREVIEIDGIKYIATPDNNKKLPGCRRYVAFTDADLCLKLPDCINTSVVFKKSRSIEKP